MESLSDDELEQRLEQTYHEERGKLADFLLCLTEFDDRRLGHRRAFGSTFDYCVKKLRMSSDEAYKRIQIIRAAKNHRALIPMIREGRLSFTAAMRIGPHLDHHVELLEWAVGKSSREIETRIASLSSSQTRAREIVEFLPPSSPAPGPAGHADRSLWETAPLEIRHDGQPILGGAQPAHPPEDPPGDWEVRLHFTASKRLFEKLERAKDLSRHKHPEARIEEIMEDALDALLVDIDRDLKERPAPERDVLPGRRRIPEWVKDIVWKRDGGACTYQAGGRRCGATAFLEYDHVTPFSLGGLSDDPENVRLLCGAHNQLVAPPLFDSAAVAE